MGPVGHTVISLGIGAGVWAATKSPLAIPVAFCSGVLIDIDHALDFYNWYFRGDRRYLLVVFHAWEFSLLGLVALFAFYYHPLLLAAVLGHLGHIITDQLANSFHPMAYSIVCRLRHRFDRPQLMGERLYSLSQALHNSIPFWGHLEPWLLRIASRIRSHGH